MSIFSHYPETWDEALLEMAGERLASWVAAYTDNRPWGPDISPTPCEVVEAIQEYAPECYEVLVRDLDPTRRAWEMLFEKMGALET